MTDESYLLLFRSHAIIGVIKTLWYQNSAISTSPEEFQPVCVCSHVKADDMLPCVSQAYLDELVELHKRLMTLREGHILQQVCTLHWNAPPSCQVITTCLTQPASATHNAFHLSHALQMNVNLWIFK